MFTLADMTGGCHCGFCQAAALCPLLTAYLHPCICSSFQLLMFTVYSRLTEAWHTQTHYSLWEYIFTYGSQSHFGLRLLALPTQRHRTNSRF